MHARRAGRQFESVSLYPHDLALSINSIGPAIAQAILIATNGTRDFDNAKQLAKFIGVCPTQFESGSSIKRRGGIANDYPALFPDSSPPPPCGHPLQRGTLPDIVLSG